ncbi:hypothetical protein T484DRAFT_1825663 [Baffinella frigidus]|nr:hypothetical protein T484DRAFT_1825663 [Cryptophyta sp. CCMP2293]
MRTQEGLLALTVAIVGLHTPGAAEPRVIDHLDDPLTMRTQEGLLALTMAFEGQAGLVALTAGLLAMTVAIEGLGHIYNSPFSVHVHAASVAAESVAVSGRGLVTAGEKLPARFCIRAADKFGNSLATGGQEWGVKVVAVALSSNARNTEHHIAIVVAVALSSNARNTEHHMESALPFSTIATPRQGSSNSRPGTAGEGEADAGGGGGERVVISSNPQPH